MAASLKSDIIWLVIFLIAKKTGDEQYGLQERCKYMFVAISPI